MILYNKINQKIKLNLANNTKKYEMNPNAFIFAGINGAGKTTLYYDELLRDKFFGVRINTDEFVSSFGNWKNPKEQFKAAKIALKLRQTCIKKKSDFNQETTLCGKSIVNLFTELKAYGFAISLYYISVNTPQIAKDRIKIRVAKGGHSIDNALIDKRFDESLQNLLKVAKFCDKIVLFDNSGIQKELIFKYNKANDCIVDKITKKHKWIYDRANTLKNELGIDTQKSLAIQHKSKLRKNHTNDNGEIEL